MTTKSFYLQNPSQNMVRYEIIMDNCPFDITPTKGKSKRGVTFFVGVLSAKQK